MPLRDFVTGSQKNRIKAIGGATGLIIAAAAGLYALQIEDPDGNNGWSFSAYGVPCVGEPADCGSVNEVLINQGGSGVALAWGAQSGGISESDADSRYVNTSGDTMTGALKVQANISGSSLTVDNLISCDTIDTDAAGNLSCGTDSDTQLTEEQVEDFAGGMVTGNTETLITVTYEDVDGTLDFIVDNNLANYSNATSGFFNASSDVDHDATTNFVANEHIDHTAVSILAGQGLSGGGDISASRFLSLAAAHSGTVISATETLASSGTLVWEGAASGASLYVADGFFGSGLADCDNATGDKLLWDATTQRFSCGSDQSGGGSLTAGEGLQIISSVVSRIATMTGTSLEIYGTASGQVVHAQDTLTSSGTLVAEGAVTFASLTSCENLQTASNGALSCNTTDYITELELDTEAELEAQLTDVTNVFTNNDGALADDDLSDNTTSDLAEGTNLYFTAARSSGATVQLDGTRQSIGPVVFDFSGTGFLLNETATDDFDIQLDSDVLFTEEINTEAEFEALLFAVLTPSDQNAGTDITADLEEETHASEHESGGNDTINHDSLTGFVANEHIDWTGASANFQTSGTAALNGAVTASALVTINSNLAVRGTMSGWHLYAGTMSGAGLTDCDTAATSKLLWDATTERFSCGTDQGGGGSTYQAGQGLSLDGSNFFSLNAAHTGSIIQASTTLASSGTLVVEGAATFNSATAVNATLTVTDLSCSGCLGANELGTDSVSADELNATGVEAELEAVLDLQDLQGAAVAGQYGAASIDGDDINSNIAGRSLTLTSASPDTLDVDSEAYTFSKTIWFEDPTAADDFATIWTTQKAVTITSISCESDQTVNFDLAIDDGTVADVNGSDIACTTFATDSSLAGDTTMAAGDRLDLLIESVSGTPTWVSITFEGTYDD